MLAHQKNIRLGLAPIGKFVFSHERAVQIKQRIQHELQSMKVDFVDLDQVLTASDGLIRDQAHVEPAQRYFRDQSIDTLFIPHGNFGTEGAAGMLAKECNVPTLLWSPRDEAPLHDGTRWCDSLCGTLATSKVLHTLRVPFSYIPNNHLHEPQWRQGVDRFLRASRVVKRLKTMRIGLLGQRIDFFWCTIASEIDLLQKFGIQIIPIDLTDFLHQVKDRLSQHRKEYHVEYEQMKSWVDFRGFDSLEPLLANYAFRDVAMHRATDLHLDALSIQTFSSIANELGAFQCLASCLIQDAGCPVGMESDIHGAISMVLLEAASSSQQPCFLPDVTARHPDNDNAVLLWHPEAALSLRDPASPVVVDRPWILKTLPTGQVGFKLKGGPLTVCRFDGDGNEYVLGYGQGKTVPGPYTKDYYAWMEVDHWPTWERQLIDGPYIHHVAAIHEHCADVFEEVCRFVPGLKYERFGIQ